ncbi:uncharacterized protein LOC143127999 [Alosa pseudoharengus]|uniref:uncharacterized protein LOC143127999 n=1 Tax=Alosa pseudoharengus TaxID=34774 RepID=UPI003F8C878C
MHLKQLNANVKKTRRGKRKPRLHSQIEPQEQQEPQMKTFLALCLITTLVVVVTRVIAELHDDHHDNNTIVVMLEKKANPLPCMKNLDNNAYNRFKNKHILDSNFNIADKIEWSKYLYEKGLCGRVPVQSFFQRNDEGKVKYICEGQGFVYKDNLCVSQETFTVIHVTSDAKPCRVTEVVPKEQKVMLACDTIANVECLPVHYEKYNGQPHEPQKCQQMLANASPLFAIPFLDLIKIVSIIFILT